MQSDKYYMPSLALVIPVYNRAAFVKETLGSVSAQTRIPSETILVDNGSQDGSLQVLEEWRDRMNAAGWNVKVLTERRKGAAAARQRGLQEVESDYVLFFDSDDWMQPNHIQKILEELVANSDVDIITWNLRFHNPDGSVRNRRILPNDPVRNHFIQGLLSTQAYVVRTGFIRSCGGWNPGIGGWDDYELGVRLLLGNPRMLIHADARVDIRVHEDSISGTSYSHRMGDWERTLDVIESAVVASSHPEKERMLRFVAYRRAILAAHYHREGYSREASALLKVALSSDLLNPFRRSLIRCAYFHTSTGLPAAGSIYPLLL